MLKLQERVDQPRQRNLSFQILSYITSSLYASEACIQTMPLLPLHSMPVLAILMFSVYLKVFRGLTEETPAY